MCMNERTNGQYCSCNENGCRCACESEHSCMCKNVRNFECDEYYIEEDYIMDVDVNGVRLTIYFD